MGIVYRYTVRAMRGATQIESELGKLSEEGWEPVNFARDASGRYEVILRRLGDDGRHEDAVLEQLEASSEMIAPELPDAAPVRTESRAR
jgi:hypothetical protein